MANPNESKALDEEAPPTWAETLQDYCSAEEFDGALDHLVESYGIERETARLYLVHAICQAVFRPVQEEEALALDQKIVDDALEGEEWKNQADSEEETPEP